MTRKDVLEALLTLSQPLDEITSSLTRFGWDSNEPMVTLRREHFSAVLRRYLGHELNADEVSAWANAIEGREDIGFDKDHERLARETLHELANPYLTRLLSREVAKELIERLE